MLPQRPRAGWVWRKRVKERRRSVQMRTRTPVLVHAKGDVSNYETDYSASSGHAEMVAYDRG